jgi:hypothetical protein
MKISGDNSDVGNDQKRSKLAAGSLHYPTEEEFDDFIGVTSSETNSNMVVGGMSTNSSLYYFADGMKNGLYLHSYLSYLAVSTSQTNSHPILSHKVGYFTFENPY